MTTDKTQVTLYKQAKAGLISLFVQIFQVSLGLIGMLVLTRGNPSGWMIFASFFLGIGFVAYSEGKRHSELENLSQEKDGRKASEVLRSYQAGERNFQGENLRGQSFKGQDLSEADFSKADIRSTNFTGANLREANFTDAKCGLQRRWVILWVLSLFLLAGILGFLSSFVTGLIAYKFKPNIGFNATEARMILTLLSIIVGIFVVTTIFKGLKMSLVVLAVAVVVGVIIAGGISGVVAEAVAGAIVTVLITSGAIVGTIVLVESIILALMQGLTKVGEENNPIELFRVIGGETGAFFIGLLV